MLKSAKIYLRGINQRIVGAVVAKRKLDEYYLYCPRLSDFAVLAVTKTKRKTVQVSFTPYQRAFIIRCPLDTDFEVITEIVGKHFDSFQDEMLRYLQNSSR